MDAAHLLVATGDADLLDDALRWCAAVGVTPEVASDAVAARRAWSAASAVLLAADLAGPLARTAPPRRDGVLVLGGEPGGTAGDTLWRDAVLLGATAVLDPTDETAVLARLGELLDGRDEAAFLAVVGAVGGAGASTFATAVALHAGRRGHRPVLVDADTRGAGVDLVLGAERAEGVRWPELGGAGGHVGATRLARLLPEHHGVAVLACPRDGSAVPVDVAPDVLTAASRAFDVVVADVPRHLDPLGSAVLARCEGAVLLVPEDVRCVAAARIVLAQVREHVPRVALVTTRRAGGVGSGPVAEALRLPVVARVAHDRWLRADLDHGRGPGRSRTLRRASGQVLDVLGLAAAGPS
ncbi:septum site-determining protein Ssd [Aeromicrobium sp.]|uniref:septum site-determining protein Ssd n=1 Tax=Aeromicrobium sp. TaxID=1871063 RepID=UPI0040340F60